MICETIPPAFGGIHPGAKLTQEQAFERILDRILQHEDLHNEARVPTSDMAKVCEFMYNPSNAFHLSGDDLQASQMLSITPFW